MDYIIKSAAQLDWEENPMTVEDLIDDEALYFPEEIKSAAQLDYNLSDKQTIRTDLTLEKLEKSVQDRLKNGEFVHHHCYYSEGNSSRDRVVCFPGVLYLHDERLCCKDVSDPDLHYVRVNNYLTGREELWYYEPEEVDRIIEKQYRNSGVLPECAMVYSPLNEFYNIYKKLPVVINPDIKDIHISSLNTWKCVIDVTIKGIKQPSQKISDEDIHRYLGNRETGRREYEKVRELASKYYPVIPFSVSFSFFSAVVEKNVKELIDISKSGFIPSSDLLNEMYKKNYIPHEIKPILSELFSFQGKKQELLKEYAFQNVGQFRAIAKELGYSEEYNKGELRYEKGNEVFKTNFDEIRSHIAEEKTIDNLQEISKKNLCQFFNKEEANNPDYIRNLLSEKNISVVRWEGLKEKNGALKDAFTIIDHENKVCYTGRSFYDYAFERGYLLDGKGSQQEKIQEEKVTEEKGTFLNPDVEKRGEQEIRLQNAVSKDDFDTIMKLHAEGYKPSSDLIRALNENPTIPDNTKIAVSKIFGLEETKDKATLANVKLAQNDPEKGKSQGQSHDKTRQAGGLVNKAFADM